MSAPISSRQWELLSAYIDGKCTPREKTAVERDLAAHPELKQTLAELTRLKTIIHSVPMRKPRRNFTLSAEHAKARRSFAWAPVLRYASLVAILAAVVVLAIDLLPGFTAAPRNAAPQAAAPMMESAMDAEATQSAPIIYWGGVVPNVAAGGDGYSGGVGGGDGGGAEGYPPSAIYLATPTPISLMVAPSLGESAPAGGGPAEEQRVAQPTETPGAEAPVSKSSGEGPILGVRPTEQQGTFFTATEETATASTAAPLPILRLVGIGLGLVGIILILATYLLRKRA